MNAENTMISGLPTIDVKSIQLPATIQNSAILQEGAELFLQHGCLVIKNAFEPDYIRKLHDEFTHSFKEYFSDEIYDNALDIGDKRTMVTISLKGSFNSDSYYAPPKFFPLLEFLLTKNLIVSAMGCVISLPGSKDQHRHRDYINIYDPGFNYPGVEDFISRGPPYAITVGIPLVRIDELNGNTRFWPGSHLKIRRINDPEIGPGVDFVADLGSCYLFDYRILHKGVGNKSDWPRPLLYNIYTRPWFSDTKNYARQAPIHIAEEEFDRLPIRDQKMFSWALVEPATNPTTPIRKGLCHCGSGLLYNRCHGPSEL
jgi:ectoine hydroxylase-related dioxygenase (phytanoyl-CoA dioxygenase family)